MGTVPLTSSVSLTTLLVTRTLAVEGRRRFGHDPPLTWNVNINSVLWITSPPRQHGIFRGGRSLSTHNLHRPCQGHRTAGPVQTAPRRAEPLLELPPCQPDPRRHWWASSWAPSRIGRRWPTRPRRWTRSASLTRST